MAARVLIVKNIQREGPGLLRDVLQENHVAADVIELDRGDRIPSLDDYTAMFVLGGPASANDNSEIVRHELEKVSEAVAKNLPFFGICLGMQLLAKAAGGRVLSAESSEIGFTGPNGSAYANVLTGIGREDPIFRGVPESYRVFQLHGETVELSDSAQLLATAPDGCANQVIRVGRRAYGFQAHLEVVPEMLAVWRAQDSMLAGQDPGELQRQLTGAYEQYSRIARLVFTNFLVLAGAASAVDLTEQQRQAANAR